MNFRLILFLLFFVSGVTNAQTFNEFILEVKNIASKQGVSSQTLDTALDGVTVRVSAYKDDADQVIVRQLFWDYMNRRVDPYRLNNGYTYLNKHKELLSKNYEKYGIPPHIIVALIGLETNYGTYVGDYNLIESLVTLAYNNRRSSFFKSELIALLKLIDNGNIHFSHTGSWDGGIGNIQFMPSNILAYAVDADNNGIIDLWNSNEDIFASANNFLNHLGWKRGEKWGREVLLTNDFDYKYIGLEIEKSVDDWQDLGVRDISGIDLPSSNIKGSIILPMGHKGPAFLVYQNFRTILRWNNSILYALSVGHLSDRIIGGQKLQKKQVAEPIVTMKEIVYIQTRLNDLGYEAGKVDGIAGFNTRKAVRKFQADNDMIIDGYAGYDVLQKLK